MSHASQGQGRTIKVVEWDNGIKVYAENFSQSVHNAGVIGGIHSHMVPWLIPVQTNKCLVLIYL